MCANVGPASNSCRVWIRQINGRRAVRSVGKCPQSCRQIFFDSIAFGREPFKCIHPTFVRLRRAHTARTIDHVHNETFDVGQDTGTPVVEDYNDKMPFAFTGTLKKLVVILEPDELTEDERKELLAVEARALMAVH